MTENDIIENGTTVSLPESHASLLEGAARQAFGVTFEGLTYEQASELLVAHVRALAEGTGDKVCRSGGRTVVSENQDGPQAMQGVVRGLFTKLAPGSADQSALVVHFQQELTFGQRLLGHSPAVRTVRFIPSPGAGVTV
ncbi:hypothetical protein FHX42_005169 [Saccharopolyspora lacisalsi]|uniref:Uncharacterized protein n=1 Tax=Halosaccharopolyspora lacisalsi TaxID=1000566 RepID=A0A839E0N5_9PSEU|nr:hypothetical protein [Halosaccharopolyspora lacisalsi]MBA8827762.1 hypothetical protein [Halosaccharopolyspora lacisalsi]